MLDEEKTHRRLRWKVAILVTIGGRRSVILDTRPKVAASIAGHHLLFAHATGNFPGQPLNQKVINRFFRFVFLAKREHGGG
jgi:hypothetical protein